MNKGETTTDSIIELTSQRSIAKSENIWKNSPFGFLVPLTSDERGHWGEDYFQELLKKHTKFVVEWNGDKNIKPLDGTYDMKSNSLRTELKTAMKGTKINTWQHDVIKEAEKWDRLVFVDLVVSGIYITVINNTDMVYGDKRHLIFKKKSTPCKGGYKFDMSNATLRRGIAAGLTYYHDLENINDVTLSTFLNKHFS